MRRIAILSCVFLLVTAGVGLAQTTKGAVRVEVKAGDGSLLPGASVVVQSPETLGQRTAVSDSTGVAIVSGLDPSSEYTVTVSLDGFQTQRFENVLVKAGGTASLAASLPLAAVEEEIVVVAEAPTVDFSSAISGQDITLQLTE